MKQLAAIVEGLRNQLNQKLKQPTQDGINAQTLEEILLLKEKLHCLNPAILPTSKTKNMIHPHMVSQYLYLPLSNRIDE